jgi:mannose-6-phosphate isomerase-like protein (cupin superfamily)
MIIRKDKINAINFNGLNIFDYTSDLDEKSSFAIIQVPARTSHQLSYSKRSDKYYYVMDGTIDFTINDNNYSMNKGDFCIVKKGEKFKYSNNTKKIATLVLVHTPRFILHEEVFE